MRSCAILSDWRALSLLNSALIACGIATLVNHVHNAQFTIAVEALTRGFLIVLWTVFSSRSAR
jgi:hypothetical protein